MTHAKNSCGRCCCNVCEKRLPKELRCCCDCVCETLCVTVSIPYDCGCTDVVAQFQYDCVTHSWHGDVSCDNLTIDLEFAIKTCGGLCYLCLTSDCLGLLYGDCPDDCQLLEADSLTCRGDYAGRVRTGGIEAEFGGLDFSDCGDTYCGSGSISVKCAEIIIPSCAAEECGEPLCEGCDCMARCLCVIYRRESDEYDLDFCFSELKTICWNEVDHNWKGDLICDVGSGVITVEIILEDDGYGQCVFRLIEGGDDRGIAEVVEACPDVSLRWQYEVDGQTVEVNAFAQICGECAGDIFCDACPDINIPRVLHGILEGTCTELGFPTGKEYIFVNEGGINNFCWETNEQDAQSLQCSDAGDDFMLCIGDPACAPCGSPLFGTIISCDPFEVLFSGFTGPYCNLRVTE